MNAYRPCPVCKKNEVELLYTIKYPAEKNRILPVEYQIVSCSHCGIPSFATHPDVFCPTDKAEWLVDCGAMIACPETSTGCKFKVLGKPDPGLLRHAAARYGISDMKQCLMVGDRLATDVAVGVNSGSVSCHIVDPAAEIVKVEGIIPDFAVRDLGELQKIWQS